MSYDIYGLRSGVKLFLGNFSVKIRFLVEMNVKLVFQKKKCRLSLVCQKYFGDKLFLKN